MDAAVKAKMFEMMHRHAASLFASDELTLIKAQIGDLMDLLSIEENSSIEAVNIALMDVFGSLGVIQTRLEFIKLMAGILTSNAQT